MSSRGRNRTAKPTAKAKAKDILQEARVINGIASRYQQQIKACETKVNALKREITRLQEESTAKIEEYYNSNITRTHQTKTTSVRQGVVDLQVLVDDHLRFTRAMPDEEAVRTVLAEILSDNCKRIGYHIARKLRDKQQPKKNETTNGGKVHATWRYECSVVAMREHVKEYVFTKACLLYTSPSPRDGLLSRMPSSA